MDSPLCHCSVAAPSTGTCGGGAQTGSDEERGGGSPAEERGHLLGLGKKDGGWEGTEEQTGLCSLGTHGYCMGKSSSVMS